MRSCNLIVIFLVAVTESVGARCASAQNVPFFGGGVVAFDPEISIAPSGAQVEAMATVSADRKYVQLNMQVTNRRLMALQTFTVSEIVPLGFVGGVNLPSGTAVGAPIPGAQGPGQTSAVTSPSPDQINRTARSWVFTRQGMFLVAPLR
jgi:hypothetical protein